MRRPFDYRLYEMLLGILPAAFRAEYLQEMLATYLERRRYATTSRSGLVRYWLREAFAVFRASRGLRAKPRYPIEVELPPHQRTADMTTLMRDIRIALRSLRRSPTFSIIAVLTLSLGIGANTAIFSVVNGVLLTPLDFQDPHQLISVWGEDANYGQLPIAVGDYRDIRDQTTTVEEFSARYTIPASLTGDGNEPEEVRVAWVTANHFGLLGIRPFLGRSFTEQEDAAVLLGHDLWQRRYGADPDIIDKRIYIGGQPHTVVGVLPPDVNPNVPTLRAVREDNQIWRLMQPSWLNDQDRINAWLRIVGRLTPGATVAQAQADMDLIARRIAEVAQDNAHVNFKLHAVSVQDDLVQSVRPILLVLMGAVTFVLLIACFNVANLLLVRAQSRSHEIAVRAALGGGRVQLIRQLLVESTILGLFGGAVGVGLATLGINVLMTLRPANVPRLETVEMSMEVLGFAITGSLLATFIFGLVPALRATRKDLAGSLTVRGAALDRGHQRISRALIVSEVALSLVLLAGTGLLIRSFMELKKIRPGFDTDHILTISVSESGRSENSDEATVFFRRLEEQIAALPGVVAVGGANRIPLGGGLYGGPWATETIKASGDPEPEGAFRFVGHDYFNAMGTRLLKGRFFEENEDWEVVIVDELFAARAWPGEDPLGKRIWTGALGRGGEWSRVIGIVEHQRHSTVSEDYNETLFFPLTNFFPGMQTYYAIRTTVPAASIAPSIRGALQQVDPNATMARVRTVEELVENAIAPNRFALVLVAIFAAVAVTLAGVGLYGVVSYAVSRRTREIGIRIAFGAAGRNILRLVVGQGLTLIGLGVLLGTLGAFGLTHVISSLLVGVTPRDPLTFVSVAMFLIVIGVLGSYMPARRALRVDPTIALRAD